MRPPRIILGDRAFLKKYGSLYSSAESADICDMVARTSALGLASGDYTTAEIVERALAANRSRHIHHSAMLIRVRDLNSINPDYVPSLSIQSNIKQFKFSSDLEIEADNDQIKEEQFTIEKFRPGFVSVGGDWLDILIAQHRTALAHEILDKILTNIRRIDSMPLLLSFDADPIIIEFLNTHKFYGLLMPVNLLDKSREAIIEIVKQEYAIFALHILALGRIPLLPALDYALNHMQLSSCIVGACSLEQISQLMSCSERF